MLSYFWKEVNKPFHLHDISRWLCLSNCYSIYTWHCGMPAIFYKVNNFLLIGWVYRIVWAINNNYAKDTLIPRLLHKHWCIKPFRKKTTYNAPSQDNSQAHALIPCSPMTQNQFHFQATGWWGFSEMLEEKWLTLHLSTPLHLPPFTPSSWEEGLAGPGPTGTCWRTHCLSMLRWPCRTMALERLAQTLNKLGL